MNFSLARYLNSLSDDVETINLDNKKINNLNYSGWFRFKRLKILYLNNNRLTNIDELKNLRSLEVLYINNNKINYLVGFSSLKELYADNNQIKEIDIKNDKLEIISINNNQLNNINNLKCANLRILSFNNNSVTEVKHDYRYLKILSCMGNNLIFLDFINRIIKLEELHYDKKSLIFRLNLYKIKLVGNNITPFNNYKRRVRKGLIILHRLFLVILRCKLRLLLFAHHYDMVLI